MNKFNTLLMKELKEIFRDPRLFLATILIPIIMFPLMGIGISWAINETQESVSAVEINVLNLDEGNISWLILKSNAFNKSLEDFNITVIYLSFKSRHDAFNALKNNETALIVIPENFSELVNNESKPSLEVYYFMNKVSFKHAALQAAVGRFISIFNRELSLYLIRNYTANPDFLRDPIDVYNTSTYTFVKGEKVSTTPDVIFGVMFTSSLMIPIIFMMLITTAIQFLSTSIAAEKEQKTLEILLTMPVKRETILFAKLASATVITLLGTLGFLFGYIIYMQSIMSATAVNATDATMYSEVIKAVALLFSPTDLLLLLIIVFLSFIASLALVTPISALVEDVRTAQMVTSYLVMPFIIPAMFIAIFVPLGTSIIGLIFLLIPFTSGIAAAMIIQAGNKFYIYIGIIALIIETWISIKIAVWFYTSEKILTAKLAFKKRK